ncbi:MAG: sigma-70 family RNA polymerase sigma factor [Leptolyngbyaceae cyanobacterium SM1_4_3]|nr:sigma-70 family RNA polymerase sigma factor [Leptolyngbyaceae cyanobacterium SM1_4_3]NJN89771.1 sigma-70 family RNA polymerase sigma factor [Leptolyngbyaceae cyanobacterium SL_5_14]NJO66236.1 sigma-70 family RNA polymerase sigma factor [Leptolyngbyaceae cyanobacterium RM1_405_57]
MHSEQSGSTDESLSSQTDAELYLSLRAGFAEALGVLYDRHAGLVYGLAFKVLGNPQEAEDLTQDIFLNLVRSSAYDSKRGSLRTFLAILTRSRAIDRVRSRNTALSFWGRWKSGNLQETDSNTPLEYVFQGERSEEVRIALAQLSESQQQILRMAYYDGLSQSEIAERLEIPLGTVKARARRGLLKLRQTLTNYME